MPLGVAGCPSYGLDKGRLGAKVALLVGVKYGYQADLRQVQSLPEEVDAHDHVVHAQAEVPKYLAALEGVYLRVEVVGLDVHLLEVVRQLLGHALSEGGDQAPLALLHAIPYLVQQVVYLSLGGLHLDGGVQEAGRSDDLLHHLLAMSILVGAGSGRYVYHLVEVLLDLLEAERAIVQRRRQPEPEVHKGLLP